MINISAHLLTSSPMRPSQLPCSSWLPYVSTVTISYSMLEIYTVVNIIYSLFIFSIYFSILATSTSRSTVYPS